MKPTPVALAQDTVLQSERNGDARIYWAPSSTYKSFGYGTSLDFEWMIHSKLNTPVVGVYIQTSTDGRAWDDVTIGGSTNILGDLCTLTATGASGQQTVWVGSQLSSVTFVRFGIQVSRTTGAQGEVGLTLTVTPRQCGGSVVIDEQYFFSIYTGPVAIGDPIDVRDASTISLLARSDSIGGQAQLTLCTAEAPDVGASDWVPTEIRGTLDSTGDTVITFGGSNDKFVAYVQLFRTAASGSETSAGTVFVSCTIRPIR